MKKHKQMDNFMKFKNKLNIFFFSALILSLTACGGSSGGGTKTSISSSSASSTPIITNTPPIAHAGVDQNVSIQTFITLDGSASSDQDGDTLTYQWLLTSVPDGSLASLSSTTAVSPTFTADVEGAYVVQLIVNDGKTDSTADTVTVVASRENSAPVANAGPDQNVFIMSVITLTGAESSDVDGDQLTYQWSLTSTPEGSFASLNDATTVSPTFTADVEGSYVVQLIVNDGKTDSAADTVTIVVSKENSAPVANAGPDQSVIINSIVTLNGDQSTDADNDGLSYLWDFVSKPTDSMATLDNPTVIDPTFTADVAGSYVLSLVVNDGLASSEPDNVQINVTEPKVTLYRSSLFGNSFTEIAFPHATSGVMTVQVGGIPTPTTYTIGTYKLKAQGKNFTITDVSATDSTAKVKPYFSGISNGLQLVDGTEVEFDLISPLTKGSTTNLKFSFKVLETGEVFSASYTFTSN